MKREVSFFKDRRATSGKALLAAMRAVGMSDAEIIEALKAAQHGVQPTADPGAQPLSQALNVTGVTGNKEKE